MCRALEVGPVHQFLAELGSGLVGIDRKGVRIGIEIGRIGGEIRAAGGWRDGGSVGSGGKLAVVGPLIGSFVNIAGAGSVIRERHRFALHKAVVGLALAEESLKSDRCIAEIVAVELREAIRALEAMVGRVGVEDLLDEIFASFCIGK